MRYIYLIISGLCIGIIISSVSMNPRNPDPEVTGAPGELTCEKSGCHSGGKFVGTVTISGIPDTVQANVKYTITLTHKSNAKVTGFELTCLDPLNKKCGILKAGTGSNLTTGSTFGRQYVRQSDSKQLVDSTASWTFSWTAPATVAGDSVAFYFSSLCGSATQDEKADNAIKNNRKAFFLGTPSSVRNEELKSAQLFPTLVQNDIKVQSNEDFDISLSFFDVGGNLVKYSYAKTNQAIPVAELHPGLYPVLMEYNGSKEVRKFVKR